MDIEDHKIEGYKNQLRLLDMVSKRHAIACEHLGKTAKEICGYDNRLAFNDYEFKVWLATGEGHLAFTTGVLGPRTLDSRGIAVISPYNEQEIRALDANPDNLVQNICLNVARKCRHNSWYIIHRDDFANMRKVCIASKSELKAGFEVIVDMAETREATKAYDAHNTVEQLF
jgi:COMPASS component SPP1